VNKFTPEFQKRRRQLLIAGTAVSTGALLPVRVSYASGKSALIAASLEISHITSLSDDAILAGINLAIHDLNHTAGNRGHSWELLTYDNGSIPSRATSNLLELAKRENLAGVFGGKFSPAVLSMVPIAKALRIPVFAPWSAADDITGDPDKSQFVFRLSMRDTWAMSKLVDRAIQRGYQKIGLILPNSGWGRSCGNAIKNKLASVNEKNRPAVLRQTYQWGGESTMLPYYLALENQEVGAVILIANEHETAMLASEIVKNLGSRRKLPIFCHWGIVGGDTVGLSENAILKLDVSFVQTFNFMKNKTTATSSIGARAAKMLAIDNIYKFPAQVGIAHAYDLMMMIGSAVKNLPKITGPGVAEALTSIKSHEGIIKKYVSPYANRSHDALAESDVFFCRYASNGEIHPDPD